MNLNGARLLADGAVPVACPRGPTVGGSAFPGGGRARGIAPLGVVAIVLVLAVPLPLSAARPSHPTTPETPFSTALAAGPCGGRAAPASVSGSLAVEGGPSPAPAVVNQTVQATYEYEFNYTPSGGSSSFYCLSASSTATTGAGGQFTLTLSIPSSSCVPRSCSTYTGPYTPTSFGVATGVPAGFFVASSVNSSTVALDFVYALASTSMDPYGRTTVSLDAPVTLTGSAFAGNGAPSPATLQYAWSLTGSGWSYESGSGTPSFTVVSSSGGSVGTVQLWLNGSYGGVVEHGMMQSATLTPVATQIVAQGVAPTSLDAGAPATFSITGSGAAGYNYSATVFPSLGLPPVSSPCATTSAPGGTISVSCAVAVTYPKPGTADPTASLTNQFSTATTTFAQLTVAPALVVTVAPQPASAYVGYPVTLTASVVSGGTGPYGPACYWPGDGGPLDCHAGAATYWTFTHTFTYPGLFRGFVSVVDSAGTNRTFPAIVQVWHAPSLAALLTPSTDGQAGKVRVLSTVYTGGALPAVCWWNDTLPGIGSTTLFVGTIEQDGPMNYSFLATSAGRHTVTLTVIDGLGTRDQTYLDLIITPGPARSIVDVGPPGPWVVAAGAAYHVSWAAVDPSGAIVRGASLNVTLVPMFSYGPGSEWVNSSSNRPVLPDRVGDFHLNSTVWNAGYLNFSLSALTAGSMVFLVAGNYTVPDAVNGRLTLQVVADSAHPKLSSPRTVESSAGSNCTSWTITDLFGNPMRVGSVFVKTVVAGTPSFATSPVLWDGRAGHVWVNYSFPVGVGGTVYVLSASGQNLLVPIVIPGSSPIQPDQLLAVFGLAGLAAGCLGMGVRGRRPAARSVPPSSDTSASTDEELQRLAEGRAHVLSRADPVIARTLDELAAGWSGSPPDAAEMTEWVSSLVAEGRLRSIVGPDGKPRFLRVAEGARGPPKPPKVELDPLLFESVLANRPEPEARLDQPAPDSDRPDDSTDAG